MMIRPIFSPVLLSTLPNARAGLLQFVSAPLLTSSFVSRPTHEHARVL
jgi:hypothetical protein